MIGALTESGLQVTADRLEVETIDLGQSPMWRLIRRIRQGGTVVSDGPRAELEGPWSVALDFEPVPLPGRADPEIRHLGHGADPLDSLEHATQRALGVGTSVRYRCADRGLTCVRLGRLHAHASLDVTPSELHDALVSESMRLLQLHGVGVLAFRSQRADLEVR